MVRISLEKLCTDTVALLDSLDSLANPFELCLLLFFRQQRLILHVSLFWSILQKANTTWGLSYRHDGVNSSIRSMGDIEAATATISIA